MQTWAGQIHWTVFRKAQIEVYVTGEDGRHVESEVDSSYLGLLLVT